MLPHYYQLWIARDFIRGHIATVWAALFAWISARLG